MKSLEKIILTSSLLLTTIFNTSCISNTKLQEIMDNEARKTCYRTGKCYREDSFYNKGPYHSKIVNNGRVYDNTTKKRKTYYTNYYYNKIKKTKKTTYTSKYKEKVKRFKRFMEYQKKHNTLTKEKLNRIIYQYKKNGYQLTESDKKYFKNYIKTERKRLIIKQKDNKLTLKKYYLKQKKSHKNLKIANGKQVAKNAYLFYKSHLPYRWKNKKQSNKTFNYSEFVKYILNKTGYNIPNKYQNTTQLTNYFKKSPYFKRTNIYNIKSGDILIFKYTTLNHSYKSAIYLGKYKKNNQICESYIYSKKEKTKQDLKIDCLTKFNKKYINKIYRPYK